jgi:hypothetical protein
MPSAICKGCGRQTNSTTSNYWDTKDREPTKCYVAWENSKPVKGCAYDKLEEFTFEKNFADEVLEEWK